MGRKNMNTIPATCRQAAHRFREWAGRASDRASVAELRACAKILDAFEDAPVPAAILSAWDFER